ncbi:MAG: zinc-ribbon domain-containing protein [Candidatus Kariarchaeaceae archaeon]
MFCENCGTKIGDDVSFCPNCGSEVEAFKEKASQQTVPGIGTSVGTSHRQPTSQVGGYYAQPSQEQAFDGGSQFKIKTGWLKYVLVMNWITVGIVGIAILLVMSTSSANLEELGGEGASEMRSGILIFLFIIIALIIWLNIKLANFSNGARIVFIVFAVLGLLGALSTFDIITMVFQGLTLYALAFHEQTVALFKNKQPYGY